MKKQVLILTYFYLPCNLTASQRVYGWVKYLHEFGYYPIVITRNWDHFIAQPKDVFLDSGRELRIEKFETHEVHYLPYVSSLRDKIYYNFFNTPLAFLSKFLTAIELLSMGSTNYLIPHSNLYNHADKLLRHNSNILKIIATGKPFEIFKFAYLLNNKYNLPWIADYRDPWNSQHPDIKSKALSERFWFNQSLLERRWIATSSLVTTVSQILLKGIEEFTGKNGKVIMNGFMEQDFTKIINVIKTSNVLLITHIGSISPVVNIEIFIEGIKRLIKKYSDQLYIKVEFIGVKYIPYTAERIRNYIIGYENNFILTDRIPREMVLKRQAESNLFYMAGHSYEGYPSSKLYEYVGTGKPVILCPSDYDIMEQTLVSTGQAIVCNSSEELVTKLSPQIDSYISSGKWPIKLNLKARNLFNRKNQTKKLAAILDSI